GPPPNERIRIRHGLGQVREHVAHVGLQQPLARERGGADVRIAHEPDKRLDVFPRQTTHAVLLLTKTAPARARWARVRERGGAPKEHPSTGRSCGPAAEPKGPGGNQWQSPAPASPHRSAPLSARALCCLFRHSRGRTCPPPRLCAKFLVPPW